MRALFWTVEPSGNRSVRSSTSMRAVLPAGQRKWVGWARNQGTVLDIRPLSTPPPSLRMTTVERAFSPGWTSPKSITCRSRVSIGRGAAMEAPTQASPPLLVMCSAWAEETGRNSAERSRSSTVISAPFPARHPNSPSRTSSHSTWLFTSPARNPVPVFSMLKMAPSRSSPLTAPSRR